MELSPTQLKILERLHQANYEIVAFPMYANYVGVRKENCAALLAPTATHGFTIFGAASYLLNGNFTVRVTQNDNKTISSGKKKNWKPPPPA